MESDGHVEKAPALDALNTVQTTHAAVTQRLRAAILGGVFAPASKLVQSEIAKMLGVSVTPVREAIRDLTAEGLVDFDAFRGAMVHSPSLDELEDIYAVRVHLLKMCIPVAVNRITPEELADAHRIASQMETETDRSRWAVLNRRFHGVIEGAAGNAKLAEILTRLANLSTLYVTLSLDTRPHYKGGADHEHREILDAIESKDVEQTLELCIAHLRSTLLGAERLLTRGDSQELTEGRS